MENDYTAARQDFAVRSGLVNENRLLSDEQAVVAMSPLLYAHFSRIEIFSYAERIELLVDIILVSPPS